VAGLADSWKHDAAAAYLATLQARQLSLEAVGERLIIPPGHTPAEVELVGMLKPELIALLNQDVERV